MSTVDCQAPEGSILVVVGSNLRAEEKDRPLAYCLQQRIQEHPEANSRPVYVVSDFRYLSEPSFQSLPALSVGGPGVNAVAHQWLEELPVVFAVDDEFCVQMSEQESGELRASVWGMDHQATCWALATFLESHLDDFLIASNHRAQWA